MSGGPHHSLLSLQNRHGIPSDEVSARMDDAEEKAMQKQPPETKALSSEAPAEPSAVRPHSPVDEEHVGEPNHTSTKPTYPQLRAAIYARVSTHNGQDPEMQLREVREYCARRGWQVGGENVDRGISG